jgi:multidrug efflux pump subunit AcrA (membrane-fusion protein)
MNMVPTKDFTPEYEVSGLEKTETSNPPLARLMKAWEGKQKTARNIGTFGLMAVGLSACGGSDPAPADSEDEVGETFTLTIGDDNFTGTEFADVFNALLASATGPLTGVLGLQTLGDTDVINGGDGTDTLNAVLNGTGLAIFDFAAPLITGIEIYNLTSRNDAGGLDLNNSTGYTQLWNINSSGDLTLINVEEGAAIGLRGTEGDTIYTVQYTSSAAADIVEQLVIANNVGGSTLSNLFTTLNVTDASSTDKGIEDLNLVVSNGVRLVLEGSAENIQNLDIDGGGDLVLSTYDNFPHLISLDSTGYGPDLTLDVSGSSVLAEVVTGAGGDVVTINRLAADGGLSVDMGDGFDILELAGTFGAPAVTALDFTGGVAGVENLAFVGAVSLNSTAILDLDGFNADLETVWFFDGLDGGHGDLTLAGSPVDDLRINSTTISSLDLDTGNVVNLEANTSEGGLDIDALAGDDLETLILNQTGAGDLYLDIVGGVDNLNALTSIEANASNEATYNIADVDITDNAGSLTDGLQSLENVSVVSDDEADLTMTGANSGIVAAQQAVDDAQADVTAEEADVTAAETALASAEAAEDQALVDQGVAQAAVTAAEADQVAAQSVFNSAAAAVTAKQADITAKQADITAKQDEITANQGELADAQAELADVVAFLNAFTLIPAGSNVNEAALDNYINGSPLSQAMKDALTGSAPNSGLGNGPGQQTNYDAYVNGAATVAATAVLGFPAIQVEATTLSGELTALQGELVTLNGELAPLQTAEAAALIDLNAANTALATAETDLLAAIANVNAAEGAVTAAEIVLADAEGDVADAEDALATAQANLAAAGPEGTGFEALETVTVEGGNIANVDLDDVYGAFDLVVTAENTATVELTDTGVVNATVSGGDSFVYLPVTGVDLGLVDFTTVTVNGDTDDTYGNQDMVTLTVEGAATNVTLANDLSSFTTLNLTGATNWFNVVASDANFAPDAGDYVTYLIGGTESEWTGSTATGGDSQITMADARETVTFTEADFGIVVLNKFTDGADPTTGDRIDLSQLGFTNSGQLLFEEGTYHYEDGEFSVGAGSDIRISDLAGGPQMSGEIIVDDVANVSDLEDFNIVYA